MNAITKTQELVSVDCTLYAHQKQTNFGLITESYKRIPVSTTHVVTPIKIQTLGEGRIYKVRTAEQFPRVLGFAQGAPSQIRESFSLDILIDEVEVTP